MECGRDDTAAGFVEFLLPKSMFEQVLPKYLEQCVGYGAVSLQIINVLVSSEGTLINDSTINM